MSNVIQSASSSEKTLGEFDLSAFLSVDADNVYDDKVVASKDGSIFDTAIDIKEELDTIDEIMALKDVDVVSFVAALLDHLGLSELTKMVSGSKELLAAILNSMVGIVTEFGGSLLLRMELLGLIDNDCRLNNHPNFRPSRASYLLFLGNLFKMLQCYGFGSAADGLLDLVDPLKEVEITPGYTNTSGVYTKPVTEMRRTGKLDNVLAVAVPNNMDRDVVTNIDSVSKSPYANKVMLYDSRADVKMVDKIEPVHSKDGAEAYSKVVGGISSIGGTVSNNTDNKNFKDTARCFSGNRSEDIDASSDVPLDVICQIV